MFFLLYNSVMAKERTYIAIDLKSFYASVECVERELDPLTTRLVVADESRTDKTICLAVSPALKAFGIPGRARLFEVKQKVKELNAFRPVNDQITFIAAKPRMALYIDYSTRVYKTYLKYIAPEDIHVYSIDEVFMDVTNYLKTYEMSAHELAIKIIRDVLDTTGITATAGIGPNMYLCKIAMDIEAKHVPADKDGVRIAELDEMSYREKLWNHRPITDFWRIGHGYAKKLADRGIYTMGDVARCSIGKPTDFYNAELLYKLFGVNAELLIDHAWGYEPCTIADIKAYEPKSRSLSQGQVLNRPYKFEEAKTVIKEMADALAMDLFKKKLVAGQIVISVMYDKESLKNFEGELAPDYYGRMMPKYGHGTIALEIPCNSATIICAAAEKLYEEITDSTMLVRRMYIVAADIYEDGTNFSEEKQLSIFETAEECAVREESIKDYLESEKKLQEALSGIKSRYGKNAILKGRDYQDGATAIERNQQIGGHKA